VELVQESGGGGRGSVLDALQGVQGCFRLVAAVRFRLPNVGG
jgi:hypothetical protein